MFSRFLTALLDLFRRPREHYDPSGDPFLELDLGDVRRQLASAKKQLEILAILKSNAEASLEAVR